MLLRDTTGNIILQLENNFWTIYDTDLFDVIGSAQGKELSIKSRDGDTNFHMRFDDFSNDKFRDMLRGRFSSVSLKRNKGRKKRMEKYLEQVGGGPLPPWFGEDTPKVDDTKEIDLFMERIGNPDTIPTWSVEGIFCHRDRRIKISKIGIRDLKTNNRVMGTFTGNVHAVVEYTDGNRRIGVPKKRID